MPSSGRCANCRHGPIRIPYLTLTGAFIWISFLILVAAVVINLTVGRMDRTGQSKKGDRIDERCRWIFPLSYLASIALAATIFFARF